LLHVTVPSVHSVAVALQRCLPYGSQFSTLIGIFNPQGAMFIPRKRGTSRTTAWLKFRHIRSARWIVNLLVFPSDNTVFHKHFPAARSCAVYAMCIPNYFVMGPALSIHIFLIAVFLF